MDQQIIQLEYDMWEAALHRDVDSFRNLVLPSAVMICGGYRCSGNEYADIIQNFYISGYTIRNMEVIRSTDDQFILHYIIQIDVDQIEDKDLGGLFHIVSIWKRDADTWNLMFNMDSRIDNP